MTKELYIGLMSGTSMDGIDAALVEIDAAHCTILQTLSRDWPDDLRNQLTAVIATPEKFELDVDGSFSAALGHTFGSAANDLLAAANVNRDKVTAIGSHGQTVLHAPNADPPFSIQLGNPETIAADTRLQVVADFRTADMQLGGQGAPLAPAFHQWVFSRDGEDRAVVNIGGIANITLLLGDNRVTGFDTGPGNTLLNHWILTHRGQPFDNEGTWAASGSVHDELLGALTGDEYFSRLPPKSTGLEYFNSSWLQHYLDKLSIPPEPQDVQSTLSELTAIQIADAIKAHSTVQQVAICGGGVANTDLMSRLRGLLPGRKIWTTADWGLDPHWVEAAAFAWLARQRIHGLVSNLPSVTGAGAGVSLGRIYLPPE